MSLCMYIGTRRFKQGWEDIRVAIQAYVTQLHDAEVKYMQQDGQASLRIWSRDGNQDLHGQFDRNRRWQTLLLDNCCSQQE